MNKIKLNSAKFNFVACTTIIMAMLSVMMVLISMIKALGLLQSPLQYGTDIVIFLISTLSSLVFIKIATYWFNKYTY